MSLRSRLRALAAQEVVVPAAYALLSASWIFLSDRLLAGSGLPAADQPAWSIAKGLGFVLVTSALLHLAIRGFGRRERDAAQRLESSERRFRATVEGSPDALLIRQGERIVYANPGAARMFGAAGAAELIGRSVYDLIDPSEHADAAVRIEGLLTGAEPLPYSAQRRLRRLDGSPLHGELVVRSHDLPGGRGFIFSIRDVTERVRLQEELGRVNTALRMLGRCNEAIWRAAGEAELLAEVCRIVVQHGGYRFAWIGRAGGPTGPALQPIARFGDGGDDLLRLEHGAAEHPEAVGFAATALRTGAPCLSLDLRSDPRFAHLAGPAAQRGLAGAVALPLPIDGAAYVLAFYSGEPREADPAATRVFERLAEDLRNGLAALRTRALLAGFLEHAPMPMFARTPEGRYLLVGKGWEATFGVPRGLARGRTVDEVFPGGRDPEVAAVDARVLETGGPVRAEHRLLLGGRARVFDLVEFPLLDAEGRTSAICGLSFEVTAQREAERALAAERGFLRSILDTAGVLVAVVDLEGRLVNVNRAVERATGAAAAELLGASVSGEFLAPGGTETVMDVVGRVLASPAPITWVNDFVARGGERRVVEWVSTVVRDGEGRPTHLAGFGIDVTERREAELRLSESREELRALAARIQGVREEEMARIARDLHDDLGQLVTALKLDLRAIERRVGDLSGPSANALLDRSVAASELADRILATVQRLAADLRPVALDRLGLGAALRQEGRAFEARTGVRCEVSIEEPLPPLGDELATALYRIAQEALTNVARHAGAGRVSVRLQRAADGVRLRVEDDGRGIQAAPGPRAGALGLLGMRERALAFGGEVEIERREGGGTVVTAELPLAPAPGTARPARPPPAQRT